MTEHTRAASSTSRQGRVVCPLCVQWRCAGCKSDDWPWCCGDRTHAEPYWPDGSVAVITQNEMCARCQQTMNAMNRTVVQEPQA